MSFASEVKKELLGLDCDSCCENALMLGLIHGCGEINISNMGLKIVIKSYLVQAIQKITQSIKKSYNVEATVQYTNDFNLNKKRYYYLEIKGDVSKMIEDYCLYPFNLLSSKHSFFKNNCCRQAFLRGMFIAKGSINDPRKNCYHFEITSTRHDVIYLVKEFFYEFGIESKIRERKDKYNLYIKKSESISNALALIGATSGVFYFEDSRIVRDISNMANRMTNCDVANVKKSAESANKQLKAIDYIRKMGYFNKMPIRLQSIALMREEYPDSTLDELSEFSDKVFGKNLSKSGISHCFRSLMQYYEELLIKNQVKKAN